MQRQITLSEIQQAFSDNLRHSLYVSMPGSIISYDPGTRTASVQPMLNDPRTDIDTGSVVPEPWPIMQNIPVMWPSFGGFILCGNLNPNDQVVLEAWDLDPSAWASQGRSSSPVTPSDVRRLGGNYWRINPADLVTSISDSLGGVTVLGYDGSQAEIRMTPSGIQLGSTGNDFVALASLCMQNFQAIAMAINGLQTAIPGGYTAPSGGGPCSPLPNVSVPATSTSAYSPTNPASSLIKAQ